MHRAFCSFNDDEYKALGAKAKKLGMSTSKLIEYATTLFLDMPRTETTNVKEIRKKIEKYLFYTFWLRMGQNDNFGKKNSSITDEDNC